MSVEIERWNLLVCQLNDLQALTAFITRLTAVNHNSKQAVDDSGTPELSVIGKGLRASLRDSLSKPLHM